MLVDKGMMTIGEVLLNGGVLLDGHDVLLDSELEVNRTEAPMKVITVMLGNS